MSIILQRMKLMKKSINIYIVLIMLFTAANAYAITGEQALQRFRNRMLGIPKMTGIISWSAGDGQASTASFKYLNPGRIYMKFSNPKGKLIITNGKKLWAYNRGSNICGIQELGSSLSGGIAGMTNGYMAIVTSQSSNGYTLKLKNSERRYSQITLMLDSSFFLKKAVLKNKDGGSISFSLSNIDTKASVMKSMFDFTVPPNAQVVNNPLNIR
jgi:outer membrane lipoprotein carrier protein